MQLKIINTYSLVSNLAESKIKDMLDAMQDEDISELVKLF